MVNYQPDLQGWADRDEDPEWMENAIARVRERQRGNRQERHRKHGSYLFYDDEFRIYIDEAARRRGMPLSAYMRRAIAAFLSHDLGVPYPEVIRHTAKPRPTMGGTVPGTQKRTYDDGQGFGPWIIEGLQELR